jgi:ribonuclease D
LEQLLDSEPHARLLHGWRKTMAGDELAAVLRGELDVRVENGQIRLADHA